MKVIYNFKTKGCSLKYSRGYQMLLELLENLKDGDVNPKNVLKNQINFKSDLIRIKRENPRFKSEERIRATQHIKKFFNWGEIFFLKRLLFFAI